MLKIMNYQYLLHTWKFKPVALMANAPVGLHQSTSLHTSVLLQSNNFGNERPLPSVYYYQNPFQWLLIKWQLLRLKRWDREFSENEFKTGSTHAISSVTSIVSHEKYDDLRNMLTPFALTKLRRDVLVLWNDDILMNIGLKLSDIKLAVPTRVHIRTVPLSDRRTCDIDMWYMAMKWRDFNALLIIDIVARFNRDFTGENHNPEWTISFFELRKFHIQNYSNTEQKR